MTRNNERASQVRDALGQVPKPDEPYQLASWAKRYAAVMKGQPIEWARSIHTMWSAGEMRPRNEPAGAANIGTSMRPDMRLKALASVARGENELRLRSMIRAIRMLSASKDAADIKMAGDLSKFLDFAWGIKRAYETVSEGDAELYDSLKQQWGEVQIPPAGAMVANTLADELLIAVAVRRLK